MAQSHKASNSPVTPDNTIADLLAAPLSADWTVEALAEQVLGTIASRRAGDGQVFVLDAATITDRQSCRVLRPLIACLATKSASEGRTNPNLYSGKLFFERSGPEG